MNGGLIVQVFMVHAIDHSMQDFFQMYEIEKQSDGIQLWALHRQPNLIIVAVRIFALAFVSA